MLFNEPKLLKSYNTLSLTLPSERFSALQRAEIAEMLDVVRRAMRVNSFSALQRAEIAEISRCPQRR